MERDQLSAAISAVSSTLDICDDDRFRPLRPKGKRRRSSHTLRRNSASISKESGGAGGAGGELNGKDSFQMAWVAQPEEKAATVKSGGKSAESAQLQTTLERAKEATTSQTKSKHGQAGLAVSKSSKYGTYTIGESLQEALSRAPGPTIPIAVENIRGTNSLAMTALEYDRIMAPQVKPWVHKARETAANIRVSSGRHLGLAEHFI